MEVRSVTAEYDIRLVLGFGSFGTVYLACRRTTNQLVAIKVLNPAGGSVDARARRLRRFEREMAICARLHHPNIVRFIDSGISDTGEPFAVPGIFVLRVRNGEIVSSRDYFDHLTAAQVRGRLDALIAAVR